MVGDRDRALFTTKKRNNFAFHHKFSIVQKLVRHCHSLRTMHFSLAVPLHLLLTFIDINELNPKTYAHEVSIIPTLPTKTKGSIVLSVALVDQ